MEDFELGKVFPPLHQQSPVDLARPQPRLFLAHRENELAARKRLIQLRVKRSDRNVRDALKLFEKREPVLTRTQLTQRLLVVRIMHGAHAEQIQRLGQAGRARLAEAQS